jgi:predicted Zn-dependent protease with MMP-like domain
MVFYLISFAARSDRTLGDNDPLNKDSFFNEALARALDDLPEEFKAKMENVDVIVEDFADVETLRSMGIADRYELLGLYVGAPITSESVFSINPLPSLIFLYKKPILRASKDRRMLVRQIRDVLIHEIGHHFGFDDDELYRMDEVDV